MRVSILMQMLVVVRTCDSQMQINRSLMKERGYVEKPNLRTGFIVIKKICTIKIIIAK